MSGLGLIGGTFDPPHIGHLLLAETALTALTLDQVVFIPVGQPTHKTAMTAAAHRLAMTRAAVISDERFAVDTIDIERPPPHYTVDLVPLLKEQWPDQPLTLILGGDSIADLPSWHRPEVLLASITIAGLERPGHPINWPALEEEFPQIRQQITLFEGPSIFASSTALREKLSQGDCSRYLLPAGVREYISRHNLYQNQP